jgi:hypothetical protein
MTHTQSARIQNVTLSSGVQCCGPPNLARLLTNSTSVMTTEVLEVRQLVQSPKLAEQPKSAETKARTLNFRSIPFGKRVRE